MSLFSAIFSVQDSERIQVLKIEASIKPTSESTLTAQHIEPLFALQRLTTLQLHLRCTFGLDDATLERAAWAWLSIRVLELGPFASHRGTRVTLAALVPFAQHCPELQALGFTLDADLSRVPLNLCESRTGVACVQRELKVLKVGRARIVDPEGVAAFLIDLLPRLMDVQHNFTAHFSDLWDEMCEGLIPTLARRRRTDWEREWTLDDLDARIGKSYHIGRRRPG